MRRREFLALAGAAGTAAALPHVVMAQAKVPRVALVSGSIPTSALVVGGDANWSAVLESLASHGFVEGRTVVYERYTAPNAVAADIGRAIVASAPDAIFWGGANAAAIAALAVNRTIPMVGMTSDPLSQGLVTNVARPGGNMTAIATTGSLDYSAKILSLLCEAAPDAKTIAYVVGGNAGKMSNAAYFEVTLSAASKLGVRLVPVVVEQPGSDPLFAQAFQSIAAARADAVQFGYDVTVQFWSEATAKMSIAAKLPAISPYDQFAPAGGLISYAADYPALSRKVGDYIALVLTGTKPGDLPVLQPTVFNLVVNLKTAKAIGLVLPQSVLLQATQVIQ